jgi:hypothetical protein
MRFAVCLAALLCSCGVVRPSVVDAGPESERPCQVVDGPGETAADQECEWDAELTGRVIESVTGIHFTPSR